MSMYKYAERVQTRGERLYLILKPIPSKKISGMPEKHLVHVNQLEGDTGLLSDTCTSYTPVIIK